ncbi:MAG: DUF4190 domain-containing protein [Caulobacterales bacterium]
MTDETTPSVAQPPPTQTINIQPSAVPASNGMALAAMVLGIIGLLTFWIPFLGWVCPIIGLVLGLVSVQRPDGRGMAIAGIACSGVAILIKVVFWVVIGSIFGAAATGAHVVSHL